jgi:hypothetical protein
MEAIFSILMPSGVVLTVRGRYARDGGGTSALDYPHRLAKFFGRETYTLPELATEMGVAAVSLGGALSVLYRPLELE